jgi:hypothetical protein
MELSPLLRWGVVAVLLVGAYTLAKATTWQWAQEADASADELQHELNLAAGRPSVDRALRNIVLGQGEIRLPEDGDTGSQSMFQAFKDIVESRKDVSKAKYSDQASARLGRGSSAAFVPANRAAMKIGAEIEFESSPEVAASVVAALEASPAVDAISRVEIRGDEKGNSKSVKVRLRIEAWVAGEANLRRG